MSKISLHQNIYHPYLILEKLAQKMEKEQKFIAQKAKVYNIRSRVRPKGFFSVRPKPKQAEIAIFLFSQNRYRNRIKLSVSAKTDTETETTASIESAKKIITYKIVIKSK